LINKFDQYKRRLKMSKKKSQKSPNLEQSQVETSKEKQPEEVAPVPAKQE
jgi:hypothetical protein